MGLEARWGDVDSESTSFALRYSACSFDESAASGRGACKIHTVEKKVEHQKVEFKHAWNLVLIDFDTDRLKFHLLATFSGEGYLLLTSITKSNID